MPAEDFLTAEQLLRELGSAGLSVEDRTLRYWTSRGLLPKPVKKPFRGADGRVGYYPKTVLKTIARISSLQSEGWKIEHIKQQLTAPAKQQSVPSSNAAQEFSLKYLEELSTDHSARERRQSLYSEASSPSDVRRLRNQLVGRLERIVGRKEAVSAVSAYLLSLSTRQTRRLVHRLRLQTPSNDATSVSERLLTSDLWKNERCLEGWSKKVDDWEGLPKIDSPPVLGRRAQFLAQRLTTLLAAIRAESKLHRKPLIAEFCTLLSELEGLSSQAKANAAFLGKDFTNTDWCQ